MTRHEMFFRGSIDRLLELKELEPDLILDYSIESVKLIDNIIDRYFHNGEPLKSMFFSEHTEFRITSLAAYVGEVIVKNTQGTKWVFVADNKFNGVLLETELKSANGLTMWPGVKTVKRIKNGAEDGLYSYASYAVGEIINGNIKSTEQKKKNKAWWKFW